MSERRSVSASGCRSWQRSRPGRHGSAGRGTLAAARPRCAAALSSHFAIKAAVLPACRRLIVFGSLQKKRKASEDGFGLGDIGEEVRARPPAFSLLHALGERATDGERGPLTGTALLQALGLPNDWEETINLMGRVSALLHDPP